MAPAKLRLSRVVLLGIGDPGESKGKSGMERAGSAALGALSGKDTQAVLLLDEHKGVDAAEAAARLAFGARMNSYRFDKYRTKLKAESKAGAQEP